jgi:thiosulfate/3-mercaptopyruvate sulfurtransferase
MHASASSPAPLVDVAWAQAHLDDPAVRFVEVDVDTTAYEQGHIPGAVAWDWTTQLTDPVRRDLADPAAFAALLSGSGIDPETTVVLYGDHHDWFAAWAYWQLQLHGHRDARLLDGGRQYWLDQGLPMVTERPTIRPTDYPVRERRTDLRALREDVLGGLHDPGLRFVDVRSPAEFAGEIIAPPGLAETAQRAGHIPGAASVPWSRAVTEDGRFRSPDELFELYAAAGITPDKDIITYCRIGERSAHTWFVLHALLGFERVRNYDGSWTEYGSLIGVPIERTTGATTPTTAG